MSQEVKELRQLIRDYKEYLSDLDSTDATQAKINLLNQWLGWFGRDDKFKAYNEIEGIEKYKSSSGFGPLGSICLPVEVCLYGSFFSHNNQKILQHDMDNAGKIFVKLATYLLFGICTCGFGFVWWPYHSKCKTGSNWTFLRYGTFFETPPEKKFINDLGKQVDLLRKKSQEWKSFSEVLNAS